MCCYPGAAAPAKVMQVLQSAKQAVLDDKFTPR